MSEADARDDDIDQLYTLWSHLTQSDSFSSFTPSTINNPFWVYPNLGLKVEAVSGGLGAFLVTKSMFSKQYERFKQLLIEARKKAGLTQVELAERLSRPQSYVSKYERGERRLDVIEFLDVAEAIGIEPIEFLRKLNYTSSSKPPTRSS